MSKLLVTANRDIASPFLELVEYNKLLQLPLEMFEPDTIAEESGYVLDNFSDYAFIVHGNLRNARYFLEWVQQNDQLEEVQNSVNLVLDKPAMRFLEENNIPGIMPKTNAKPIDILEFMLRISKEGNTLYPTTENKTEEMPGLLKELEMAVHEFTVCREIQVDGSLLDTYNQQIDQNPVDSILFHNRSSVIRTRTAFPNLPYSDLNLIAGSEGAARKMEEEGLSVHQKADGTWKSIASILN